MIWLLILVMILLLYHLLIRMHAPHLLQLLKMIYIYVEEECRLFGFHFEQMCHEPQEIRIYVSKKYTHMCTHTHHGIHILLMFTHITPCMLICTLVHIVDVRATLQNFVMINYIFQILQINLLGLGKVLTPMDPRKYGYQNPPLLYLM